MVPEDSFVVPCGTRYHRLCLLEATFPRSKPCRAICCTKKSQTPRNNTDEKQHMKPLGRRQAGWDVKKRACIAFEQFLDKAQKQHSSITKRLKNAALRHAASIVPGITPARVLAWKEAFLKEGVVRVSDIANVPMKSIFTEYSATRSRDRRHIASGSGGHNVSAHT